MTALNERIAEFLNAEKESTHGEWRYLEAKRSSAQPWVETTKGVYVCETANDIGSLGNSDAHFITLAKNLAPAIIRDQQECMWVVKEALGHIRQHSFTPYRDVTDWEDILSTAQQALAQVKALEEK